MAREPWFTVLTMQRIAITIVALDILLLLIWASGGVYLLVNFRTLCFQTAFYTHFLILIHFALGIAIASVEGEIEKEGYRFRSMGQPMPATLPYEMYTPLAWALTACVSTVGDAFLLAAGALDYEIIGDTDACQAARLGHVIYDAIALFVSLATVVWFIFYAATSISSERRKRRHQDTGLV